MSDVRERDLVTYDPLSEVTRRERKVLLGVSMLGLALVKVPLIPSKVATFGIEFSELHRQNFTSMFALVVGYFLIAFLVYSISDFIAWRRSEIIRCSAYLQAQEKDPPVPPAEMHHQLFAESGRPLKPEALGPCPAYRGFASWTAAVFASRLRALFEFALPMAFAIYVLEVLLRYSGAA